MHSPEELIALSKVLAKVLRHEPDLIGLVLDSHGYARIDELIQRLNSAALKPGAPKRLRSLPTVTHDLLSEVVASNDKKRFAYSSNGRSIRATQGHSIDVNLGYDAIEPPAILYHGTAASKLEPIRHHGLQPITRHAVHLSESHQTALRSGARHGRPLVLQVAALQMHQAGFQFFMSDNNVWLTPNVPPRFLQFVDGRLLNGGKL
jgi:putative RNA 2'-phosphotransferase